MTTTSNFLNEEDVRSRRALVRTLTNQLNEQHRSHRQTMASHEDLAQTTKAAALRSDQGHATILSMVDELSDQVAEGHQVMATKSDLAAIAEQLAVILEHLIQYDHVVIPRGQSNE